MTVITGAPPLSVGARRRALCELADLYAVEQAHNNRPLTAAMPTLLDALRGFTVPRDVAVDLFDQVARARSAARSAVATYAEIDRAESRAEQLLDSLLGESAES